MNPSICQPLPDLEDDLKLPHPWAIVASQSTTMISTAKPSECLTENEVLRKLGVRTGSGMAINVVCARNGAADARLADPFGESGRTEIEIVFLFRRWLGLGFLGPAGVGEDVDNTASSFSFCSRMATYSCDDVSVTLLLIF